MEGMTRHSALGMPRSSSCGSVGGKWVSSWPDMTMARALMAPRACPRSPLCSGLVLISPSSPAAQLTFLFVAHDLSVVWHVCHRGAVMCLGQLVELTATTDLFEHPLHPYTAALMRAVPVPDPRRRARDVTLRSEVPSPLSPPSGCCFDPRCVFAQPRCRQEAPALRDVAPGHLARCHFAGTMDLRVGGG